MEQKDDVVTSDPIDGVSFSWSGLFVFDEQLAENLMATNLQPRLGLEGWLPPSPQLASRDLDPCFPLLATYDCLFPCPKP